MRIASEGYPFIVGPLVPGVILAGLYPMHQREWLLVLGAVLILAAFACLGFFRNPTRRIPSEESVVLSPADGKVLQIVDVTDEYVGCAKRVDIFLSVFDVHVNRIPVTGTVEFVHHRPGKFVSAFKDKASTDNERIDIGIQGSRGRIRVAQIAGIIARRIICRVKPQDLVRAGQRYGLIRFGSRAEITFPDTFAPVVRPGEHVKGGETIIGRLIEHA